MKFLDWLQCFESLLSDLVVSWDGMLLVTGDFNIDLLKPEKPTTRQYMDVLQSLNLEQLVSIPTRTAKSSATLIDHIFTNFPRRVTHIDVLPCPLIGDHDAPYATINVRVSRFAPRFKFLRNEKHFCETAFTEDFSSLPFEILYALDDPEDQVDIINGLINDCLDRHAPLKRTKLTRPPAPWINDPAIRSLQEKCRSERFTAHKVSRCDIAWKVFRDTRNQLKSVIAKAKRTFTIKALSSKRSKDVWKVIHRILHPSPQPLRADPDELNKHFASTAERVTAALPLVKDDLYKRIESLPDDSNAPFLFRQVTHGEVLWEIKALRSDCSCGPDNIPSKIIKLVADHLASPLTYILNTCISQEVFPSAWKLARISPIPKVDDPKSNNDYRPISILPVLSKIYEKLALRQMAGFLTDNVVLNPNISAYRKGHSTATAMIAMRDDILTAMKKGEVTIAVMADFSKAFDTVAYETVLFKLHHLGFSKASLRWITSYLTDRRQFVQIDDRKSSEIGVTFGVPQGSILGPVLFNLYVNDLSEALPEGITCHQYADDTTFYSHCKPNCIQECQAKMQKTLDVLSCWSVESNLALNSSKTKTMLFSTQQMSRTHNLDVSCFTLTANDKDLERLSTVKLLGTHIHQHLLWTDHVNKIISSCYSTLAVLRKLKNLAPFSVKKQLAECLVLSKLDYNDTVFNPLPAYLIKRLQKVQLAAAGFVLKRYANEKDLISLGWLPIPERRDYNLLKLAHKALYSTAWPAYLPLQRHIPSRSLRSSGEVQLVIPFDTGTFQHSCAKRFNSLPRTVRNIPETGQFLRHLKAMMKSSANSRLLDHL